MKVMLDTNVFNHLVEGSIDPASIPSDWEPVITHLQNDEIERTADPSKRKALQAMVIAVVTVKVRPNRQRGAHLDGERLSGQVQLRSTIP
ncbi:hypothetical protein EJ066_24970 [Mesorhizobium sp. M9A.F.Ca.ET.002.03.1.2]|uniref:hypothetical protein n=1 Tax=Mesorhizobium sp. M9A.F.Ca.ET.002.03.1.2 TaxID=2493668 RepID=UPI000F74CEF9|nr:hypothetical protein [Mesorhizobium sp. M9A.F.Ca.ET.002.03.1.2]AZO00115.1 hypothetical protein EJ066_24970 [Mesorhizobium sp. M9A.F.Ca.ET.002.03.1.2]